MAPPSAGVPAVDITDAIADARREWRDAGDDLLYQELMSTYVVLGELIESGYDDADFVGECRDLADRLLDLDRQWRRRSAERWAAWRSRISSVGEVGS